MQREQWGSKMGAILAVAGVSVGLGNFLRFPGQVAEYGGGAFMIAYFTSMFLLGLPLVWAEWTLGREAGVRGLHSAPSIMQKLTGRRESLYVGVLGTLVCSGIYMYYVCVESWCLGYFVNGLVGNLSFENEYETRKFFFHFVGMHENGLSIRWGWDSVLPYFLVCTGANVYLLKKGISKGIERFVTWAAPLLFVLGCLLLLRVMTLGAPDPAHPERSIRNGLGFIFNPTQYNIQHQKPDGTWVSEGDQVLPSQLEAAHKDPKQRVIELPLWRRLLDPNLWLAATGQVFFSVGIGVFQILTYATFLRRNSDVALSGLTAFSINLFCEVCFGGLIAIPAAVAFLGTENAQEMRSLFSLGFQVFPLIFEKMQWGGFFRAAFFFILFIAAVTSSVAFCQPGLNLATRALGTKNKGLWALMGFLVPSSFFILYFSKNLKAMDTTDFWIGSFILLFAGMLFTLYISIFIGGKAIVRASHRGALVSIPSFFSPILTFLTPFLLVVIFLAWFFSNFISLEPQSGINPYVRDLLVHPHPVALLTAGILFLLAGMIAFLAHRASR